MARLAYNREEANEMAEGRIPRQTTPVACSRSQAAFTREEVLLIVRGMQALENAGDQRARAFLDDLRFQEAEATAALAKEERGE